MQKSYKTLGLSGVGNRKGEMMKKICRMTKKVTVHGSQLRARAAALLLAALIMLPAMRVYAEESLYEVQAGDCLWKISERFLGEGARYTDIAEWNEELIQDPNLIYPGMLLRIVTDTEINPDTETVPDTEAETEKETETDMQDMFSETLVERSIIGTINDSSWANEWLGMRFDLPEGFRLESAEEFLGSDDEDYYDDEGDMMVDVEFVAGSTAPGTVAYFALTLWDDSVEEFMEKIKPIIEKGFGDGLGTDMEWGVDGTTEFGGKTFEHYIASSELWGLNIYQDYYVAKQDDIVFFFFTMYIDGIGKNPKVLLDGFSEYTTV